MKKINLNIPIKFIWERPFDKWTGRYSWENGVLTHEEGYLEHFRPIPYDPLSDNTLFAKFADIEPSDTNFLCWANKYGPLFLPVEKNSCRMWHKAHAKLEAATGMLGYILQGIVNEADVKILTANIRNKLNEYPLILRGFSDDPKDLYITPTSLYSAFWWQVKTVWDSLTNGETLIRRCSVCGEWEDMAGHRSNWSKHDNCANKVRVARYNQKRRS